MIAVVLQNVIRDSRGINYDITIQNCYCLERCLGRPELELSKKGKKGVHLTLSPWIQVFVVEKSPWIFFEPWIGWVGHFLLVCLFVFCLFVCLFVYLAKITNKKCTKILNLIKQISYSKTALWNAVFLRCVTWPQTLRYLNWISCHTQLRVKPSSPLHRAFLLGPARFSSLNLYPPCSKVTRHSTSEVRDLAKWKSHLNSKNSARTWPT